MQKTPAKAEWTSVAGEDEIAKLGKQVGNTPYCARRLHIDKIPVVRLQLNEDYSSACADNVTVKESRIVFKRHSKCVEMSD